MRRRYAAFLAALALVLGACGRGGEPEARPGDVLIYYLSPEEDARGGDRIQSRMENLELPEGAGVRDRAEAVVKRLLEGPADGTLQSPLPGLELLGLEIRDRTAYVDLSSGFNQLVGVGLSMADYCLTLSLTGLDGIGAVRITAQGRPVGQQLPGPPKGRHPGAGCQLLRAVLHRHHSRPGAERLPHPQAG